MINDFGYFNAILENLNKVNETQGENIKKAAALMTDAIANDRLISVYGGGDCGLRGRGKKRGRAHYQVDDDLASGADGGFGR